LFLLAIVEEVCYPGTTMARTILAFLTIFLFASCAGVTPDPTRMADNAADFREIRDSGIPAVQRILARNKAAYESGVTAQQLALESGIPLFQVVMETYVTPKASVSNPSRE
jgi:hypothetical protein